MIMEFTRIELESPTCKVFEPASFSACDVLQGSCVASSQAMLSRIGKSTSRALPTLHVALLCLYVPLVHLQPFEGVGLRRRLLEHIDEPERLDSRDYIESMPPPLRVARGEQPFRIN